jgi:peptide chain release factor 3
MVLDSAKGIEPQTEKLFHVCRMHGIPILTFINKMDHVGRDPLDLLDQIERTLSIAAVPVNWPIGSGQDFQGVYDLQKNQVLRFEHTVHGQSKAPVTLAGLDDPALADMLGAPARDALRKQAELLAGVGAAFSRDEFLSGKQTPVFFGSALNNFGVEPFLNALLDIAPAPQPRQTDLGPLSPADPAFSGFVFKIQANMDPKHRDRMAFIRVCSGRFEKDMLVNHPRVGKNIRVSRVYRLFAQERETIEEAFPGDVIGVINPGLFAIGDTITSGKLLQFPEMPRFSPEHFGLLRSQDMAKYKQFHKGLADLEEEGAVQVFHDPKGVRKEPILAAVGELQFDVALSRLRKEYGVKAQIERLPYQTARWVSGPDAAMARLVSILRGSLICKDRKDQLVVLFQTEWNVKYYRDENPDVTFSEVG